MSGVSLAGILEGMSTSQWLYLALLAAVVVERLGEMVISKRNAAWSMEQGGIEVGASHFKWMVLLHTGFLFAAPLEVVLLDRPFLPWLGWPMLAALVATMGLRYWVIATLGQRWNTRVILVPGLSPVDGGPYRWIRHPNYLAVVVELAALPLIHGAWLTALVFSALNAWMLAVRIRVEEQGLREHCGYTETLGDRPRFLPESR